MRRPPTVPGRTADALPPAVPAVEGGDLFNLFRYITFRAGGAFMTALMFGFLFGPALIKPLRRMQKKGQPIRDDGPEGHIVAKAGTPTMGGVLILAAVLLSTLLWGRLDNGFVWLVLFVTLRFRRHRFRRRFHEGVEVFHERRPRSHPLWRRAADRAGAGWWASVLQPEDAVGTACLSGVQGVPVRHGVPFLPLRHAGDRGQRPTP
jgi:phospho-N-acetylmuramoyl-pentapeptide-transferase